MNENFLVPVVVRESGLRAECMEWRLVLASAGISARAQRNGSAWFLVVDQSDLDQAEKELTEYMRENVSRQYRTLRPEPSQPGAVGGVIVYAILIILIALATLPWGFNMDLFAPGAMQSGKVVSGEFWRCVTALTLHVDEGHLASNLLFGVLFGYLSGRMLGGGIAWLSILVAGTLGNLANGYLQQPDHSSVGASTAVFAALGILVAGALRPRRNGEHDVSSQPWRQNLIRRWSPLAGGVVLLAMIGVGDGSGRIDVLAHVTGFIAGLATGWIGARLSTSWLEKKTVQLAAGTAAIAVVMLCWAIALAKFAA